MLLHDLAKRKLISPPDWLCDNTAMLTIMGSQAYGVSHDDSDFDVYGFCFPSKHLVFPHTAGEIPGFGRQLKRFEQWQQHHVQDSQALGGKGREYDFSVYSIVRYFHLAMENNPNMLDSLFTTQTCVLHATKIAQLVRDNRRLFLHKGAWHTYRGYAFSQLHKMEIKADDEVYQKIWEFEEQHNIPRSTTLDDVQKEHAARQRAKLAMVPRGIATAGPLHHMPQADLDEYLDLFNVGFAKTNRFGGVKVHGTDWKFGYHVVRLVVEAEQILSEHDIDLQRDREMLKDIRRGNWSLQQLRDWFTQQEARLTNVYEQSTLRHSPDEAAIKRLLLNCLEEHYGSLDKCVVREDEAVEALREVAACVAKYRYLVA